MTEKFGKDGDGERSHDRNDNPDPLSVKSNQIERYPTDQKLWDSLPSIEDPYDPRWLSEREIAALEEALRDGFGRIWGELSEGVPLPAEISSGLLHHANYWGENPGPIAYNELGNPKKPATQFIATEATLDDELPLGFSARRLRIYFCRQLERFRHYMPASPIKPYEKPWYESHAIRFLDELDYPDLETLSLLRDLSYARAVLPEQGGLLGRLVEQYFWRFQYERPAMTGLGARSGASAGGKKRALERKEEQMRWQAKAEEIRSRHPQLKSEAVANAVKKQLKLKQSAKHIARYLRG